ncbi:MAG: sugar phosphate nucleotidyltransferase [bacterium]
MNQHTYAMIMAGGRGERFWPLSTAKRPKQLLSLVGGEALLAAAVRRLIPVMPAERIFVITNDALVEASRAVVPLLPPGNVIGEPCGRDTAAAIALAATLIKARDPQAVFAVLTADHLMRDEQAFRRTLSAGLDLAARHDVLVTIGIAPAFASTGFGYIRLGAQVGAPDGIVFRKAEQFLEKPDADTAKKFVQSGQYVWNGGMFIWSVACIEKALRRFRPPLGALMDALAPDVGKPQWATTLAAEYGRLEKISIDYAVMEKADNIWTACGDFGWDDVGSWPALERHFARDANGNVMVGDGAEQLDSRDNLVVANGHLTALLGVKDLIVVQAEGATLVCTRERAEDLKKLLAVLHAKGRYEGLM